jgi:hypothetical protein
MIGYLITAFYLLFGPLILLLILKDQAVGILGNLITPESHSILFSII